MGFKQILKNRSSLRVDNNKVTNAANLTLRQSLWPLTIVTLLFFLWVSRMWIPMILSSYRTVLMRTNRGLLMACLIP